MKNLLVPFVKISGFYILIGLMVRIILFFLPITDSCFSFIEFMKIYSLGFVNDFCVSIIIFIPFWLYLVFLSDSKYDPPKGYIFSGLWLLAGCLLFLFQSTLKEYGKYIPLIVLIFIGIKFISYILFLLAPSVRKKWRYSAYFCIFFLYIFFIICTAAGEFLFYDEFGTRYDFAVLDSLIHTGKITVNYLKSYPVIPLFSILSLVSLVITSFFVKKDKLAHFPKFKIKLISTMLYIGLIIGAIFLLSFTQGLKISDNVFADKLQANGLYEFYTQFIRQKH